MTRPLSHKQALILATVAVVAFLIGGWRLLTLPQSSSWGRDAITVSAPFKDVAGLRVGTRVHLQGVDVGEVAAVDLPDIAGGNVTVQLRLTAALQSRLGVDARVNISKDNPLADRIVRLEAGSADSPRLHDGAVLAGIDSPDLFDGLAQATAKLNALLGEMTEAAQSIRKGEQGFTQDVAQSAKKLNAVLGRLDDSLSQVEKGKGTLGKLLHDEKLYNDLSTAAAELKAIAYDVRQGEGSAGAFIKDRAAYEKTLEAIEDVRAMVASVRQNSDAMKNLPVVRSYIVDVNKELVRPDMKRVRRVFAEEELFEKGRAVLTENGKAKLDAAADWLKGTKTGEVMVASIAAPTANAAFAQTLTTKQADAVREFLVSKEANRTGWWWWNTRSVRSIGCGNTAPSQPETEALPANRVEVILFLPEK